MQSLQKGCEQNTEYLCAKNNELSKLLLLLYQLSVNSEDENGVNNKEFVAINEHILKRF